VNARMLSFAVRLAFRDLRGGLKGFRIFILCLALGVTAIAGVGSLSGAIYRGLTENGRAILGGDVALRLTHRPALSQELAWLEGRATVSGTVEMRTMARGGSGRVLVELKAVDGRYPLYGQFETAPPAPPSAALAFKDGRWGALVEATLLRRLNLKIGDPIAVGDTEYVIRATIAAEPDRVASGIVLGPRVMVAAESLAATGLVQVGSLVRYHYLLKLPAGESPDQFVADLNQALPDAGWRIRDRRNGAPSLRRFIERLDLFLTLVGLTALLVGGVGVANGVRNHLDGKIATIATLKCIGASGPLILAVYLAQVMIVAALAIVLGLIAGAVLPIGIVAAVGDLLPIPASPGLHGSAIALAALYGLLTTLTFALWPIGKAREVSPASLFRQAVAVTGGRPRIGIIMATAATVVALAALAIVTAENKGFAAWFVVGSAVCFLLLRLAAAGVTTLARRVRRPRSPALRLALVNLARPGAATTPVVLSLGIGLTLLVAIISIEGNMVRQISDRLPDEAPAFFFIDIQKHQLPAFLATSEAIAGVRDVRHVPSLRGRITKVAGVPVENLDPPSEVRWVVRGDRALTYAAEPPDHNTIVAGTWWPADYRGPPLVSMEAGAATALGLAVGDSISVNVLGRAFTARIENLRQVDWSTMAMNFVLIFDPSTLAPAPHTHLATAKASAEAEAELFDKVTAQFTNVTAVRMKEALAIVNDLLRKIGYAIRGSTVITLLAGVFVLAGAMATGQANRTHDSVILKVLGATRADIIKAYVAEYALLGILTAIIALIIGTITHWIVMTEVLNGEWLFMPAAGLITVAVAVTATVVLGLFGTWRALSEPAAPLLRVE